MFGKWAMLPLTMGLSACAVNQPAHLRASSGALAGGQAVMLMAADPAMPLHVALHDALAGELARRGHTLAADGPLLADFAVAVADAEQGQVLDPPTQAAPTAITWQVVPRDGDMFDGCHPVRVSATLAVLRRADGQLAYRGEAEAIACDLSQVAVADLASTLLDAAASGEPIQP